MSHAHLGAPNWWKPVEQISLSAPRVPDAEERLAAFRARNEEPALTALAKEFFGLIDPESDMLAPAPERGLTRMDAWGRYSSRPDSELFGKEEARPLCPRELIEAGRWGEALEAYKDRFFERMRTPPESFALAPRHPLQRDFIEFANQPDELLQNIATFFMYRRPQQDETQNGIVVKLFMGESGAINWMYTPEAYGSAEECLPDDERFCPRCYAHDIIFDALVLAYRNTLDTRYLDKYQELLDDRAMNFRSASAGKSQLEHWMWAARETPEFSRHMRGSTLARVLLNYWKRSAPGSVKITRGCVANRQIQMYLLEAFAISLSMPEFSGARYVLREQARVIESMYSCDVMPDGSNVENALCYNAHLLESWKYYRQMQKLPLCKAHITPEWAAELRDNLMNALRYVVQNQTLGGCDWYPMYFENLDMTEYFDRFEPAYDDPILRKWLPLSRHEGCKAGNPNVTSLQWPYMGASILRTGSDFRRDQECFMSAPRPSNTHQWKNNLDLQLFAFDQPLLTAHTDGYGYRRGPGQTNWEKSFREEMFAKYGDPHRRGLYQWDFTPVFVDGCPQIDHAGYESMPEDFIAREGYVYGSASGHRAYYTPLPKRWIESEYAAMMEGEYDGAFAAFEPNPNAYIGYEGAPGEVKRYIDDVTERRLVVLLKQIGVWIVADRLEAASAHEYAIDWKFAQKWDRDGVPIPGFERSEIGFDEKRGGFVTHSERGANLSVYMSGAALRYEPETNHYSGVLSGAGEQLAVSCLYPRGANARDLAEYKSFADASSVGFDAETPDGTRVTVRVSRGARGHLIAGPVEAEAELVCYTCSPEGVERGFGLGMREVRVRGLRADVARDCAFSLDERGARTEERAYLPLELVKILPEAEVFTDEMRVSLVHPDRDAEIRYTLDGSDPDLHSPLYGEPFTLDRDSVRVKARAFRKGLSEAPDGASCAMASAISRAAYRREALRTPDIAQAKSGILERVTHGEGFLSAFAPMEGAREQGRIATALFEGVTRAAEDFAVEYEGFLYAPKDGVYTFYAPEEFTNNNLDCGYDLRLWLGKGAAREEWYPSTRVNGMGGWSAALKRGMHALRVLYVDQRGGKLPHSGFVWRGAHPTIELSGPECPRQPLPASWLYHAND